jgi:glycosyltransferase involved in cell wall biosynthesis
MVPDNIVGFQCEPEPADIARAIARYYTDNREADMTAAVHREKKQYSWERLAAEINRLVNSK